MTTIAESQPASRTTPPLAAAPRPRRRIGKLTRRAVTTIVILVGILLVLFPVYWMFVTSLTTDKDLTSSSPRFFPDFSRLGIYKDVLADTQILKWLGNSAVIAIGTAVCTMVLGFFAAYALSRYRFKGQSLFGFALFATQMLPEALLVVPFYALFVSLGLLNNLGGLVLVHTAFVMPVVVFLLKSAIDGVPVEIEESAKMDGASSLTTATLVVAPLIAPSLAAGAIVAFFYGWDEFLFASTFITDEGARPASVGLASFIGEYLVPINTVMAASAIYTLPAIAFFVLLQRYVVSGLISGSIKG
ncbi:carbohydrate ABC transporter permease [Aeromicrobium chenweiae]|uniref:Sugar ABC transporter n=1 Tax=Aeromicrobium chenweiae TaxID=2079793 RepID=A0A2S0WHX8_9ACTN|nr:carbohydrate ABC transporter permease [Aeromicrobium chenweiae]AWB90945.1 sugar ABC transporter [Aeromicrobium chenweiae]TGN32165.1 carbohydrate ABC transporter permease [Aeromicrobium chenweiae]